MGRGRLTAEEQRVLKNHKYVLDVNEKSIIYAKDVYKRQGLIITTVYQRKRNVLFRCIRKLFKNALKADVVVKKDITEHLVRRLIEIKNDYPKVQKKLDEDGFRNKIQKRYEGKQKLK